MAGAAPQGFAPIFVGWNVWDVWQSDDPPFSVMNIGLDLDRQLRIWVENQIAANAPGAAVADPANPLALRGDQIQIIPKAEGLEVNTSRADVPEVAGTVNLGGGADSKALFRTVRFFNRGAATSLPWPHEPGYLLDTAYTPSSSNPITNAPQPGSLGGAASETGKELAKAATVVLWVGAGLAATIVAVKLLELATAKRRAAA